MPVSGWAADRLDRRHIGRAVLLLEMLCALILFVATWRGFITIPILFGVAALLGVARAFAGPAFGALAPNLVPREILPGLADTAGDLGVLRHESWPVELPLRALRDAGSPANGSYDLQFRRDRVQGSFSAPMCLLCSPRPTSRTCLDEPG